MITEILILCGFIWVIGAMFSFSYGIQAALKNLTNTKEVVFIIIIGILINIFIWPAALGGMFREK